MKKLDPIPYIWENASVAVGCLEDYGGPFEDRLWNAYISALMRLDSKVA
jgi:hypothetical protein